MTSFLLLSFRWTSDSALDYHPQSDNHRFRPQVVPAVLAEVERSHHCHEGPVRPTGPDPLPQGALRAVGPPSEKVDGEHPHFSGSAVDRGRPSSRTTDQQTKRDLLVKSGAVERPGN